MKHNIFLSIILLLFPALAAIGQTRISGTVKEVSGEPVAGAVVMLKDNSAVAAVSDLDGRWELNVPEPAEKAVLVVNCLGYKEIEQLVGKIAIFDFVLREDSQLLEDAVVVGYGSMNRSDLTGSVASVKIDNVVAAKANSLDQLLHGHAAGVDIVSNNAGPDAGVTVRVRGMGSFNGSNEPLYVVDGVILNSPSQSESIMTVGTDNEGTDEQSNGLLGISPQDISNIEILKDASATAIYGALGANGVILITTKTAVSERPTVNFSTGVDVSSRYKKMDILSFDEYVDFLEAQKAAGITTEALLAGIYENPEERSGLKVSPIDWQDYSFRTAVAQRYHFSISGRPKSLSYTFSVGYSDKQGIVKSTGLKTLTTRLNLEKQVSKRFRIGTKSSISYIDSQQGQSSGKATAATSLIRSILSFRPYVGISIDSEGDEEDDPALKSGPNRWLTDFVNDRKEIRVTPSMYAQVKFPGGFSFKSTLGGDYRNSNYTKFKSSRINSTSQGSTGAIADIKYLNWNWDNVLSYQYKKRGHNLSAMAGISANSASVQRANIQGWNIVQYKGLASAISSAPNASNSYIESHSTTLSFFTRAVYNWKDRYVLTTTWRLDGSSKFRNHNKWASFPSAAFAWRMNEEPWFNVPLISQTKLRIGWGRVGNQAITSYQTMSNYTNTTYADHSIGNGAGFSVGLVPVNIANPDLKWETTEQFNLGLDFAMWKGRFALTVDAYDKMTYDLLQQKNIATSSGFETMWVNEGVVRNRGLEFTLDATPVVTRDFGWHLSGNISFNRNKIMSISETASSGRVYLDPSTMADVVYFYGSRVGSSNYANSPASIFMTGYEMGLFYGYRTDGIVQEGETGPAIVSGGTPAAPGHLKLLDTNGNGYIDPDDRMIIGNPNPKFTYGFSTSLTYKGFSLSATFYGRAGGDIINVNNMRETDTGQKNHNIIREAFYDSWTPENQGAKYWAVGAISSTETRMLKDVDIEDGSYLRLSNVSLSYDVPIGKNKVLRGLNIGASANNLWFWTKYSGWDPDVNSYGSDVMRMGADTGSYPSARTFSLDFKFTF